MTLGERDAQSNKVIFHSTAVAWMFHNIKEAKPPKPFTSVSVEEPSHYAPDFSD